MAHATHERLRLWPLLFVAIIGLLTGCDNDDDDDDDEEDPILGVVRVINAVPDSPTLTAQFDERFFSNVSFAQSSSLDETNEDNYELDLEYSNPDGSSEELVDDLEFDVDDEDSITLLVYGPLEAATVNVIEERQTELDGGQAEVHFFNAVSNVDSVDFYLTDPDADIASVAPDATLAFGAGSSIAIVSSGDYRIRATAQGSSEVLFDSGVFEIASLTRRLFVGVDYFGAGDGIMRVIRIDPNTASTFPEEVLPSALRMSHLGVDAGLVDVRVGDAADPLFAGVDFGVINDYFEVEPGLANVIITPAGEPETVLFENAIQFIAGERRTLILAGAIADDSINARLVFEDDRRVATQTQLRVVHGSTTAGAVDFYLLSPGQPISDASPDFGNLALLSNGILAVEPGTYDVAFTPEGEESVLFGPERISLSGSGIYSIFLTEARGGGPPIQVRFADDFSN